ncbi:type IIL restriction-modification enzyme MmeI, partial [Treponema sp. R8-4-B8]
MTASPSIVISNALPIDWETIVPKSELSYILGNPPFVGYAWRTEEQHKDMDLIFQNELRGHMDYVACWYKKASKYIQNTSIRAAFVSTNSICQGEQVTRLWKPITDCGIRLDFAYRTFRWSNEAKGKAAVHCVIIGFSMAGLDKNKTIFEDNKSWTVEQINPYLVAAPYIYIEQRNNPLCKVPTMSMGNMPRDGGNLLLSKDERDNLIKCEPLAKKYIRGFSMGDEFINNIPRYCLWLKDCPPNELKKMLIVIKRVEKVRQLRLESKASSTRKKANTPALFGQISNMTDNVNYIAVPKVSSERRKYIPIGFLDMTCIPGDKLFVIPNSTLYHFGIIISNMHMAWMKSVCGRLKSDYSYSNTIVYNNFPWPNPTEKQKSEIEKLAQAVLDARKQFPNASLADLYDPLTMPKELLKAHQKLDKAVETAYGRSFDNDS